VKNYKEELYYFMKKRFEKEIEIFSDKKEKVKKVTPRGDKK
jgi:hypothetical protein